jgi:2-keto-3-deoxy-L-rhamnonate aldolase RhmA
VANIRKNRAKEKLQAGGVVTTISGNMSSEIIDFLGPLGFDAVWLECEHGPVSWEQISDMTRACDLWGLSSVTRVNANEPWLITRTLDRGSMGIVAPHVNTAADAQQAVQSAKFAPLGYRGMFGGRQSYGVPDYFQHANDQTMVVVLLEEVEALQNLEEILKVDYVDVFFVAPSDLAQTMGHLGNPGHPEVQEAIDKAIAQIVASGRVAGTLANDASASRYLEQGVRFLMTSWNAWLAQGAAGFLSKVAAAQPK